MIPLECEGALSDAVLQASQAVVLKHTSNPDRHVSNYWAGCGPKNKPLLPLLDGLIDSATVTASAIADNCWDDSLPLPADKAKALAEALYRIAGTIIAASAAPTDWNLPSMTGAELV